MLKTSAAIKMIFVTNSHSGILLLSIILWLLDLSQFISFSFLYMG